MKKIRGELGNTMAKLRINESRTMREVEKQLPRSRSLNISTEGIPDKGFKPSDVGHHHFDPGWGFSKYPVETKRNEPYEPKTMEYRQENNSRKTSEASKQIRQEFTKQKSKDDELSAFEIRKNFDEMRKSREKKQVARMDKKRSLRQNTISAPPRISKSQASTSSTQSNNSKASSGYTTLSLNSVESMDSLKYASRNVITPLDW